MSENRIYVKDYDQEKLKQMGVLIHCPQCNTYTLGVQDSNHICPVCYGEREVIEGVASPEYKDDEEIQYKSLGYVSDYSKTELAEMKALDFCPKCGKIAVGSECPICHAKMIVLSGITGTEWWNEIKTAKFYKQVEYEDTIRKRFQPLEKYDRKAWDKRLKKEIDIHNQCVAPYRPAPSKGKHYEIGHVPKCPICGSTNLQKLSGLGKGAKIAAFGLFGAGDIGKTYKCKNCGSKF